MAEGEPTGDERRSSPELFEGEGEFSNVFRKEEDREEWASNGIHPSKRIASNSEPAAPRSVAGEGKRCHAVEETRVAASALISRIGLNDNKAGMQGIDKVRINQIILDASRGSKFYENELRKEKQLAKRVNHMLEELKRITPAQKIAASSVADREFELLEAGRDLSHIVVHIDMDAFYAAVEMRDNPHLRDVPMAVGSNAMLSTSNYHARRYGVRAAMPGFIARKLCPQLVIVPLNFSMYRLASEQVREILGRYDPHFSPVGLDESYLDLTQFVCDAVHTQGSSDVDDSVTGDNMTGVSVMGDGVTGDGVTGDGVMGDHVAGDGVRGGDDVTGDGVMGGAMLSPAHWWCAEGVVREVRREIEERTGLTASAGLAPNMMLAKVASDMNKPNGQFTVPATRDGVLQFVQKLPIRKISGIGNVTEYMLNALSVTTCGDLYRQRGTLHLLFSKSSSSYFLRVCLGLGSTAVCREYDRKSMSTERTFAEISEPAELQRKCEELCHDLAQDMKEGSIKGHTVTIKLKTVLFEVKTRAVTLLRPLSSARELYEVAGELLAAEVRGCAPNPLRLRLMGVRISSLTSKSESSKQETLDSFICHTPTNIPTNTPTNPPTIPQTNPPTIPSMIPPTNAPTNPSTNPPTNPPTNPSSNPSSNPPANLPVHPVSTSSTKRSNSHSNPPSVISSSEDHTRDLTREECVLLCPICGRSLSDAADNSAVNQHIDECLNQSAIRSPSRAEYPSSGRGGGRERTGRGKSKGGGRVEPAAGRVRKKRAVVEVDGSGDDASKRRKTLIHFWKKS